MVRFAFGRCALQHQSSHMLQATAIARLGSWCWFEVIGTHRRARVLLRLARHGRLQLSSVRSRGRIIRDRHFQAWRYYRSPTIRTRTRPHNPVRQTSLARKPHGWVWSPGRTQSALAQHQGGRPRGPRASVVRSSSFKGGNSASSCHQHEARERPRRFETA